MHSLNLPAARIYTGPGIDADGIDAAVAQDRRQMVQIMLYSIKSTGKQMAQIVWVYLTLVHPGFHR